MGLRNKTVPRSKQHESFLVTGEMTGHSGLSLQLPINRSFTFCPDLQPWRAQHAEAIKKERSVDSAEESGRSHAKVICGDRLSRNISLGLTFFAFQKTLLKKPHRVA